MAGELVVFPGSAEGPGPAQLLRDVLRTLEDREAKHGKLIGVALALNFENNVSTVRFDAEDRIAILGAIEWLKNSVIREAE